jgi:hypothetical protein
MRGLIADVYKFPLGNCGGVTDKVKTIVLVGDNWPEIFTAREDMPAFKLVTRVIMGERYDHLEPVEPCPKDKIGYMMGGNFAYTSDSRFGFKYPLPIHDRSETQAEYDAPSM